MKTIVASVHALIHAQFFKGKMIMSSQVISSFKVIAACALVLAHAFTHCYGLIFRITKSEQFYPDHALFVCSEHHYLGDQEQNLQQLKYFIENVLTQEPMHLIIESKFFYDGIDITQTSPEEYFKKISHNFFQEPWSFDYSPQDASVTTWIGWHLPLALMAIHHMQDLPYSIQLTHDQREYIKNNITAEFCDPRLLINSDFANHHDPAEIKELVEKKFDESIRLSPTKLKNLSAETVNSQISISVNNPKSTIFCAQLFDINALSSIIKYVFYPTQEARKKKIVVICGDWHASNFWKLLPSLDFFDTGKSTGLPITCINDHDKRLNQSNNIDSRISLFMAQELCAMLGFINNQSIQYTSKAKCKLNFDGF